MPVNLTSDGPLDSLDPEVKARFLRDIYRLLDVTREADRTKARAQVQEIAENLKRYRAEEESTPTITIKEARRKLLAEAMRFERQAEKIDVNPPFLALGCATFNPYDDPDLRQALEKENQEEIRERRDLRSMLERRAAKNRKRAARWPIRGGRGNVHTMSQGTPTWRFVFDCCRLFSEYRPGDASGSSSGDFFKFTAAMYGLSTGEGVDQPGVGLEYYVRGVASRYKKAGSTKRS